MSFDAQSKKRLDLLGGKVVTLLVDGRITNRMLARGLVLNAIHERHPCAVLDLDAMYSSNSDFIFGHLSEEEANSIELLVPKPGSDLQAEMAQAVSFDRNHLLIVDSFNSLFHLLPARGRSSRSRNLAFIMAFFSFLARTDGRTVVITKYRRAVEGRVPAYDNSDHTLTVTLNDHVLNLDEERVARVHTDSQTNRRS